MSSAVVMKPLGLTHKLAKELKAASLLFELPIKKCSDFFFFLFVCLRMCALNNYEGGIIKERDANGF